MHLPLQTLNQFRKLPSTRLKKKMRILRQTTLLGLVNKTEKKYTES